MTNDEPQLRERVIQLAVECRQSAYAPYSGFRVGAAVVDERGRAFVGCNVENSSYGLTMCAERTAIGSAVAAGAKEIRVLAVASSGGASPCGACRQVLHEFAISCEVLLHDIETGETRLVPESALLPSAFEADDLDRPETGSES